PPAGRSPSVRGAGARHFRDGPSRLGWDSGANIPGTRMRPSRDRSQEDAMRWRVRSFGRTAITYGILAAAAAVPAPSAAGAEWQPPDPALVARARQILARVPLVDGHNDVPWQYRAGVK